MMQFKTKFPYTDDFVKNISVNALNNTLIVYALNKNEFNLYFIIRNANTMLILNKNYK